MQSSMLCADGADSSCAAMYTNATEFLNKCSGRNTGQIQNSSHQKTMLLPHAVLISMLELTTWMSTGVLKGNRSLTHIQYLLFFCSPINIE